MAPCKVRGRVYVDDGGPSNVDAGLFVRRRKRKKKKTGIKCL